jgi:hypothetical protein
MHEVPEEQDTLSSEAPAAPAGLDGVMSDQPVPFQCSAVGLPESSPTVVQEVAEEQERPPIAPDALPSAGGD